MTEEGMELPGSKTAGAANIFETLRFGFPTVPVSHSQSGHLPHQSHDIADIGTVW